MANQYEFFIAGRTRNKENILRICKLFDEIFPNLSKLEEFLSGYNK